MYDDIKFLISNTVGKSDVFEQAWDLYNHLAYDGSLNQIIDGNISIYYYDLREWAVDNYKYIELALEEGICEGVIDFHQLIQCGQYVAFREEAQEIVEGLFEELDGKAFNVEEG